MNPLRLALAASLLLSVTACLGDSPTAPIPPEELEFAAELGVDLSQMTQTVTGLYFQDEVVGEGAEATFGTQVTVHYTGWLHDGEQFDTSIGGQPFTLGPLGFASVISGWNEGIYGMRVGGRRLLVIPPHLAYGAGGAGGVIPPNATLVFRIELLQVTG